MFYNIIVMLLRIFEWQAVELSLHGYLIISKIITQQVQTSGWANNLLAINIHPYILSPLTIFVQILWHNTGYIVYCSDTHIRHTMITDYQ